MLFRHFERLVSINLNEAYHYTGITEGCTHLSPYATHSYKFEVLSISGLT